MKRKWLTLCMILMLAAGACLLLYPTVSNLWNQRTQSRAIATYQEKTNEWSKQRQNEMLQTAENYNQTLMQMGTEGFLHPDRIEGYEDLLDITGTGIMGYVTIEKLDVELPIYHGTDAEVLQIAVGHLQGSSLPVGGIGTHSVISAHRGLPSARLFTDLDKLEQGDTFEITVLDRLLTYQVDQIEVVNPDEIDLLQIDKEKDYCTLMTCTPYGVNSHRLLVRGVRIENKIAESDAIPSETHQIRTETVILILILLLPCLFVIVLYVIKKFLIKGR